MRFSKFLKLRKANSGPFKISEASEIRGLPKFWKLWKLGLIKFLILGLFFVFIGDVSGESEIAEVRVEVLKDVDTITLTEVFRVVIAAKAPIGKYHLFFLNKPLRLVVDLNGVWKNAGVPVMKVKDARVSRIRIGEHADKLRVVMDLKGKELPSPVIEEFPKGLGVSLPRRFPRF
ncbi:AMIN domain-containing protein [Desulfobacterales bacterium HSG2]|nr:AMIN domain-containing protein [Desulfobacterales bacterium HSG2]